MSPIPVTSVATTLAAWLAFAPPAGWLGVVLSARDGRPVVAEVIPGSPAQRAGLRPGDQVIAVGEESALDVEEAIAAITAGRAGERLVLVVRRGSASLRFEASLTLRPH